MPKILGHAKVQISIQHLMKITTVLSINVQDFDQLVEQTYGRPYSLQQQDGGKGRGVEKFIVPDPYAYDCPNDTLPEEDTGEQMGVSFNAWLARDPAQQLDTDDEWDRENSIDLFWRCKFYPTLEMVTNDLHARGLLPAGQYQIVIDW